MPSTFRPCTTLAVAADLIEAGNKATVGAAVLEAVSILGGSPQDVREANHQLLVASRTPSLVEFTKQFAGKGRPALHHQVRHFAFAAV